MRGARRTGLQRRMGGGLDDDRLGAPDDHGAQVHPYRTAAPELTEEPLPRPGLIVGERGESA
jgi:hypothetical protein